MSHGPTKIASKGCCIYCGTKDGPLSREHIVPLSLGGHHVIEQASCEKCADITKRFEQDVARGLWGDARISANAPSRRKKDRPAATIVGHPTKVKVPYSEYPASFVFYQMPAPGILQGLRPETDRSDSWKLIAVCDDEGLRKFERQHKTKPTMRFRHVPVSFGRMIAKIGYGHILTQLDMGDFEPLILPQILGTNPNVSHLVGCIRENEEPHEGLGYKLSTLLVGASEEAFIIAEVRLLANCNTPTYCVVVGRTRSVDNTRSVIEKLGPGELHVGKTPSSTSGG